MLFGAFADGALLDEIESFMLKSVFIYIKLLY
jgi:hypothetical protein